MKKIKVVRLITELNYGGVETRVFQQVKYSSDDYDLRICAFHKDGVSAEKIRDEGGIVKFLGCSPGIKNIKATLRLYKYLKKEKIDILHASIPEANFHGAIAGKLAKVPIVITEEVGDPTFRSWKGHTLAYFSMYLSSHTVGVSPSVTEYLIKTLKLDKNKVTKIENGVEDIGPYSEIERKYARQKLNIPNNAFVIGSVGRLNNKLKRFSDLIEAIYYLSEIYSNIHCLIAGEGKDRKFLEEMSESRGLGNNIHFLGQCSDMHQIYPAMDVFSLLSEQEAFGLVVVEAMLAGLPTVVTAVGGMKSIVLDKQTGFLVNSFSPDEVKDVFIKLIESECLRKEMGVNARERAVSNYTVDRYQKDLYALYNKLYKEKL